MSDSDDNTSGKTPTPALRTAFSPEQVSAPSMLKGRVRPAADRQAAPPLADDMVAFRKRCWDLVESGDWSAPHDRALAWSGPGNREKSAEFQAIGYVTIADTTAGKELDRILPYSAVKAGQFSQDEYDDIWDAASARFASSQSGNVTALVVGAKEDRTFRRVEQARFLASPRVTMINRVSREALIAETEKRGAAVAFEQISAATPITAQYAQTWRVAYDTRPTSPLSSEFVALMKRMVEERQNNERPRSVRIPASTMFRLLDEATASLPREYRERFQQEAFALARQNYSKEGLDLGKRRYDWEKKLTRQALASIEQLAVFPVDTTFLQNAGHDIRTNGGFAIDEIRLAYEYRKIRDSLPEDQQDDFKQILQEMFTVNASNRDKIMSNGYDDDELGCVVYFDVDRLDSDYPVYAGEREELEAIKGLAPASAGAARLVAKKAYDKACDWLQKRLTAIDNHVVEGFDALSRFRDADLTDRERAAAFDDARGFEHWALTEWANVQLGEGHSVCRVLEATLENCKPFQGDYLVKFEEQRAAPPKNLERLTDEVGKAARVDSGKSVALALGGPHHGNAARAAF